MSWAVIVTSLPVEELEDKLREGFAASYPDPSPGVKEQFESALRALDELKNRLIQGSDESLMYARANGHVHAVDPPDAASVISVTIGYH